MDTNKKLKVFIQLSGGLGNQMFQYAFAKAIISKTNGELYLDTTLLEKTYLLGKNVTRRKVELDIFHLSRANKSYRPFTINLGYSKLSLRIYEWVNFFYLKKKRIVKIIQNQRISPLDFINKVTGNCYLIGSFQSELYFDDIKSEIVKEFEFKEDLVGENKLTELLIKSTNAVSVHVRRGDYLYSHNVDIHGVCSIDYYARGINYIKSQINDCSFFVFSDDIEWAKHNLNFGDSNNYFIAHNNGPNSYNDMRLMSLCKHNIIANSSFSWWGAWLNQFSDKIVIAPQKWLNDDKYELMERSIVPHSWVKL